MRKRKIQPQPYYDYFRKSRGDISPALFHSISIELSYGLWDSLHLAIALSVYKQILKFKVDNNDFIVD